MPHRLALIHPLKRLGGIATLGTLYQEVFKITECTWKTKTPFVSIRQIVQLAPEIYKIKPGLWALESHRKELEVNGIFEQTEKNKESVEVKNFNHSYYQGLLLTMGNLRGKNTFVPNQDKNKHFDERTLGQSRSLNSIPEYSFSDIVQRSSTIDVIWFNQYILSPLSPVYQFFFFNTFTSVPSFHKLRQSIFLIKITSEVQMKSIYKKILLSLTFIFFCLNIYSLSYVEEYDFLLSDLKNYCTYGYKTTYDDVLDKSQGIINLSQGSLQTTDFSLDIGIVGNGFFKVVDEDGNQFYSRYGKLSIDFDTGAFYIICNNKKYFLDLSKVSGDFYFPDNIKIHKDGTVEYTTYKNPKSSLLDESKDKLIRSLSDSKIVYLSEINDDELQKKIDESRQKLEENKVIESAGKIILYDITANNIESYDGYLIKTKTEPSAIENPVIYSGCLEMSNVYLDKILIRMLFVIEKLSNSQIKQKETKKFLIQKMLEPDYIRVKLFGYFYEQNPNLHDISGLKDFVHFLDRFYE